MGGDILWVLEGKLDELTKKQVDISFGRLISWLLAENVEFNVKIVKKKNQTKRIKLFLSFELLFPVFF